MRPGDPFEESFYSNHEFFRSKWFGNVIVGTQSEADYFVNCLVPDA